MSGTKKKDAEFSWLAYMKEVDEIIEREKLRRKRMNGTKMTEYTFEIKGKGNGLHEWQ